MKDQQSIPAQVCPTTPIATATGGCGGIARTAVNAASGIAAVGAVLLLRADREPDTSDSHGLAVDVLLAGATGAVVAWLGNKLVDWASTTK